MPPRKKRKAFASTENPHREAQNDAHSAHSHAVQLESHSVASYDGPITRSRALRGHSSHPIHSIPFEVLGEILILALPTDQELYKKYSEGQKVINQTLVFCTVCSSWRSLAFLTPRLWNTVLIHVPANINKARAKRKAAVLVQWIERSRSLPITLHVSGAGGLFHSQNRNCPQAPIISVIRDHASRWESLYFLGIGDPYHFDGWQSLRRLYCPYFKDFASCANETVPWAHLTHLRIWMLISCQDAAVIFMKLPKLVFLSISVTDRRPSTIGQSTVPIILENLVTFVLKTQRLLSLQTLVHRLSLPSLREFSIKDISAEGIQPLLNLLTRSSCSLDRLKIRGSYLSPGDNLNVLTHSSCDSLTWLTIGPSTYYEHGSVDEEVLQRLILHRNDTVCHHLTFLAIKFCIPTPLHSTLLNMVKSRIKSHTSQVPEESALRYLKLRVEYLKDAAAELDKVGRKSGMEYSRTKRLIVTSVRFRRQGFREPPNIGEPF